MNLENLYNLVEKENIKINNYKWSNSKARIFEIDGNYYVGLDNTKISNDVEEKEVLAEELGHYYCNALYYINSDKNLKNKCEYRAQKWAYSVLVPLQTLQNKIAQGLNLYELAEYFEVDCEYMYNVINFYIAKYGVLV